MRMRSIAHKRGRSSSANQVQRKPLGWRLDRTCDGPVPGVQVGFSRWHSIANSGIPIKRTRPEGHRTLLQLTGLDLSTADIVRAAKKQVTVELSVVGAAKITASQIFADFISTRRAVYGRSTGVGANRNIGVADPAEHAVALLRSHATASGLIRSNERIRAMLVVRLNQLAAGGSGASIEVARGLAGMLAADALPNVRELGSIGTGDLSALATTALTLMGESPTKAGDTLQCVNFGAQDAMAFLSSNAGVIADAALCWSELNTLCRAYSVVAGLSFTALDGNAEAYSPVVERATPFPGARQVMGWLRQLTSGAAPAARIQDPFGLRAIPQAHGPALDALRTLDSVIQALANAPSENPILWPAPGSMETVGQLAHHAGFHAAYLGQALDSAVIALAQSAQLIQARLATLTEPAYSKQPPFLGDGTAGASGIMVLEYVSASALAEIRAAATPAGLQSIVISRGVEEDASFASLAARQAAMAASALRTMLACELVAAVRAIRLRQLRAALGGPIAMAFDLCGALSDVMADRDLTDDIDVATELLAGLAEIL